MTRDQVEARYWKDTNDGDHDNSNDNDNDNHFEKRHGEDDIAWLESRIRRNQGCSGDYLFDVGDENQGCSGDYLFDVGDDYFLDGEDSDVSGWCRFINHAAYDDDDDETVMLAIWKLDAPERFGMDNVWCLQDCGLWHDGISHLEMSYSLIMAILTGIDHHDRCLDCKLFTFETITILQFKWTRQSPVSSMPLLIALYSPPHRKTLVHARVPIGFAPLIKSSWKAIGFE